MSIHTLATHPHLVPDDDQLSFDLVDLLNLLPDVLEVLK